MKKDFLQSVKNRLPMWGNITWRCFGFLHCFN